MLFSKANEIQWKLHLVCNSTYGTCKTQPQGLQENQNINTTRSQVAMPTLETEIAFKQIHILQFSLGHLCHTQR